MSLRRRAILVNPIEPLEIDKNAARTPGSAIHGEKIYAQARKVIHKGITMGSSRHQIERVDLEINAYAVIAKPLRWLASPK